MRVEHVAWDDAEAAALRTAQQAELRDRYGDDDIGHAMTGASIVVMVLVRADGQAVACGALRDAQDELGPGTGELKRMYVRPSHRGRGLSRRVLAELEAAAPAHGLDRLVLETGVLQPEAIGLYLASGYAPIDNFGEYVGVVDSRCFAKRLGVGEATCGPRRRVAVSSSAVRPSTSRGSSDVVVEQVAWEHPDAYALRRAMVDELTPLYPEMAFDRPDGFERLDAAQGRTAATTFLARRDGVPVACATHRRAVEWGDDAAELKRLYVAPDVRGSGLARRLVVCVEDAARADGARRIVLDTGIRQLAAIRLYLDLGYRAVAPLPGTWQGLPVSLWFARDL